MALLQKRSLLLAAALALIAVPAWALNINEVRIDQTGSDNDEYFELAGLPAEALTDYTYIVIGDGTGACGVVEAIVPLAGYSVQADGFVSFGEGTMTIATPDVILAGTNPLNFENSDNVTHMLVRGWTGAANVDLDTNDDGVLDVTPWTAIVDCVGLTNGVAPNCAGGVEYLYCAAVAGPDGTFVPGHVFLCSEGWRVGPFDPSVGMDTPGSGNDCTVGVDAQSWSNVKKLFN